MASYPVYDTDGSLLGNYAWKDIPKLFKDRWYLEKGVFRLKPPRPVEDQGDSPIRPRPAGRVTSLASTEPASEDHEEAVASMKAPEVNKTTKTAALKDNRICRFERADGQLVGYFRPSDRSVSALVRNSNRHVGGTYVAFRRYAINRTEILHFLRKSLQQPGLSDRQRNDVLEELRVTGPFGRVETEDGRLVGFFSEGDARKRWKDVKVVESRTSKRRTEVRITISEHLTDRMVAESLQESSVDIRLSTDQRREIERALRGIRPDSRNTEPRKTDAKNDQGIRIGEAAQQEAKTPAATKEPSGVARVQVVTADGRTLGSVKRSSINKREGKWESGFCKFDGTVLLLSPGVVVPPHKPKGLMTALDKAYEAFHPSNKDLERVAREEQTKQKKKSREQIRNERRQRIVERCLEGRSPECQGYVRGLMLPKESREVARIVETETKGHPELYEGVESYEHIKLATLALANDYDRKSSDSTDDLLERAHLFTFDDEAWWEARGCSDPLTHLPYSVCLVEDVLIWDIGNGIMSRAISPGAIEEEARRMLSFVVNRCVSNRRSNGTVAYSTPQKPLPGHIAVSSVRGPTNNRSGSKKGTHAPSSPGRSPRVHSRRGHWRNQAYGPGRKLHRRIWISDTIVRPGGKTYRITEPTRIHFVTLADITD